MKECKLCEDHREKLKSFNDDTDLLNESNFESLVTEFSDKQTCVYDTIAPEKEFKITDRKRVPWFNEFTKKQKLVMQNVERKWLKYGENHQWEAYKRERNRYRNGTIFEKKHVYSETISKTKGDT